MNAKTILFPTDLSELSQTAIDYAGSLAGPGGQLLIVHVQEPSTSYVFGDGVCCAGPDVDKDTLRRTLEMIRPQDPQVRIQHRLLAGTPVHEIVRLAETENVDLIVMATHGRTGLIHALMGSVAETVVRRAPCPVLTVKARQAAAASTV